ncbi:hypothetical protein COCC4DRAFT_68849 [Bipolaris maydis ATCC 48331]|uniref:Uncharacterized protein n=2 Tax=Cochliobolus heterostrophus TaxID=5016 RepID=M2SYL8_COCH5|nr:uncharacterized protein COCC4DRAFT_68849 [Bipolaris maydis ATCC 48331]EMD90465.1 hypothetical protein COCHEDRAFT_1204980 [Bipolaris maydis C5]ENI09322.1 hypothetical protein COCC4DRAFT_68849 [Bipolaris maydis ATCC 48331]KAJ6206372.1 hypothetical protein PSV09DRAFT_1204980 [Bipolaris maydis]
MSETWDMYGRLGAIDKTAALGHKTTTRSILVHIGHAGHLRNALRRASLDRPRSPIAPPTTLRAFSDETHLLCPACSAPQRGEAFLLGGRYYVSSTWAGWSDRANYSQHCQVFGKQKRHCGEGYRPVCTVPYSTVLSTLERVMCSGHMSEVAQPHHRLVLAALPAAPRAEAEAAAAAAAEASRPKTISTTPTRKTLPATHPLTSAEAFTHPLHPPAPPEKGIKAAALLSLSGRPGKASGIRVMLQHHMLDTPPTASSPPRPSAAGAAATAGAALHGRLLRPAPVRALVRLVEPWLCLLAALIKRLVASHLRPCMSKSSFAHCARHEQPVAIFAHAYPRVHNAFAVPVGQLRSD